MFGILVRIKDTVRVLSCQKMEKLDNLCPLVFAPITKCSDLILIERGQGPNCMCTVTSASKGAAI